jgi:hypothetical protein
MNETRRGFVRKCLWLGPVSLPFWIPSDAPGQNCALPQDPGTATEYKPTESSVIARPSVGELAQSPGELQALRAAFAKIQQRPASDVIGYEQQVLTHCRNCGGGTGTDIHFTWSFLPWHRCYLHFFERILNAAANTSNIRLPYWNWEEDKAELRNFPQIFAAAGQSLFNSDRHPAANLTNQDVDISGALASPGFEDFGGGPDHGGTAYSSAHARVHNWTHGIMRNPRMSPRDPVFFAHHANIDRLWVSWLKRPGHSNPAGDFLKEKIYFYDEARKWRSISFNDLLDERKLGYEYRVLIGTSLAPQPGLLTMNRKDSTHFGLTAADLNSVRSEPAKPRFVTLRHVRNLAAKPSPENLYGIFIGALPAAPLSVSAPSFVGSASLLESGDHAHAAKPINITLNVTGRLRELVSANGAEFLVAPLDATGRATAAATRLEVGAVYLSR